MRFCNGIRALKLCKHLRILNDLCASNIKHHLERVIDYNSSQKHNETENLRL